MAIEYLEKMAEYMARVTVIRPEMLLTISSVWPSLFSTEMGGVRVRTVRDPFSCRPQRQLEYQSWTRGPRNLDLLASGVWGWREQRTSGADIVEIWVGTYPGIQGFDCGSHSGSGETGEERIMDWGAWIEIWVESLLGCGHEMPRIEVRELHLILSPSSENASCISLLQSFASDNS